MLTEKNRWYLLKLNKNISELAELFSKNLYGNNNAVGFELLEVTKRHIRVRFIEKRNYIEKIIDPYGNEDEIRGVKYSIFTFEIFHRADKSLLMTIQRPPLSIAPFAKKLQEMTGIEVAIFRVALDLADFYGYLKKSSMIDRIQIPNLTVSGVQLNRKTSAKMDLVSSSDAYKEFCEIYEKVNYKLNKMTFNIRHKNADEKVIISSSGNSESSQNIAKIIQEYMIKNV